MVRNAQEGGSLLADNLIVVEVLTSIGFPIIESKGIAIEDALGEIEPEPAYQLGFTFLQGTLDDYEDKLHFGLFLDDSILGFNDPKLGQGKYLKSSFLAQNS